MITKNDKIVLSLIDSSYKFIEKKPKGEFVLYLAENDEGDVIDIFKASFLTDLEVNKKVPIVNLLESVDIDCRFNIRYHTKNNVFDIVEDRINLDEILNHNISKNKSGDAVSLIEVYNKKTCELSTKTVYWGRLNGFYFKGLDSLGDYSCSTKIITYKLNELIKY